MEDYKILTSSDPKNLEREVMKYLSLGYSVAGGVSVLQGRRDRWGSYSYVTSANSGEYSASQTLMQAVYKLPQQIQEKKII